MPNPYLQLLQKRSGKTYDAKDNPKLKLVEQQMQQEQQPQSTGNKMLDDIIANPDIKTVKTKQPDGTFKLQTKDEYVQDQMKLMGGTIRAQTEAEKPMIDKGGYDSSTDQFHTPEIKYLDTKTGNFFTRHAKGLVNAGSAVFNAFSGAAEGLVNRVGDFFETSDSEGRKLSTYQNAPGYSKYNADGTLNPNFEKEFQANQDYLAKTKNEVGAKDRAAAMLGVVSAAGNAYFAQYNALIQSAKKSELPLIKQFGEVSDWVFGKVGDAGNLVSNKILDTLPVSEDTKNIFREPFVELGSTLFTLGTLKAAHVGAEKGGGKLTSYLPESIQKPINTTVKVGAGVVSNPWMPLIPLKNAMETKIRQRIADKVPITEGEAKKIVNESVKETELPPDPGKVTVKSGDGKVIDIETNNKTVLKNLIKGQEDLTYKKVNDLGKDLNGNPVVARFEWDYKRKEGTIYVTKETTAAEIAHEFGHYLDRQISSKIGEKLSDLLPEYKSNQADINGALAGYAANKLAIEGKTKITGKDITREINDLAKKFNRQIEKLAASAGEARDSFSEKFASAMSEIITNPTRAEKIAPETFQFIQHNLQFFGFMRDKIMQVAKEGENMVRAKKDAYEAPRNIKKSNEEAIYKKKQEEFKKVFDKYQNEREFDPADVVEFFDKNPSYFERSNKEALKNLKGKKFVYRGGEEGVSYSVNKETAKWFAMDLAEQYGGKASDYIQKTPIKEVQDRIAFFDKNGTEGEVIILPRKPGENAIRTKEVLQESRPIATPKYIDPSKALKTRGINLDKVNAPDDVVALVDRVSSANNEFRAERGKKTTLAEMKEHSMKFYGDENAYKGLNKDIIGSRDKMLAAEQMMVDLAQDAANYLRKIDSGAMTPEQQQTFMQKMLRLEGVQKSFSGARSEAARLLGSLRAEMSPGENAIIGDLVLEMKKLGLDQKLDVAQFFKKKKETLEPTIADKAWHIWYANILSGPSTQVRNFVGNFSNMLSELGRVALTSPKELPSAWQGLYDGLTKGVTEAKQIFKEGKLSKFEERKMEPTFEGKAKILNYFSYVGRSMAAVDAFFREGFRGMEAKGAAFQKAKNEGLTGQELVNRTNELYEQQVEIRDEIVKNGMSFERAEAKYGKEMVELAKSADEFSLRGTYNNKPTGFMGVLANALSSMTTSKPTDSTGKKITKGIARTIVPFTRVVANVINVGIDWTPLGFTREGILKTTFENVKEGKIPELTRRQHQELGRATVGTVATFMLGSLAAGGLISGTGPSDAKKRSQLMASGWRPNSIKIGDTWVPYSNLGPLGIPMAVVSNYFDAVRYGDVKEDDAMSRLSVAVLGSAKTITDMSFLSGVSDLMEAVNDPKGYGSTYIKNYTSNLVPVPAAYIQIRKYFDPTVYDTPTIKSAIMADLGITGGLKPRLNVFGQEVKSDYVSKLQPIPETKDETIKFLAENQLWISVPSKSTQIKVNGEKRPMTSDEYYLYVKYSGQNIKTKLDQSLSKLKNEKDTEKREKLIDKIVQNERDSIKKKIQNGSIKN